MEMTTVGSTSYEIKRNDFLQNGQPDHEFALVVKHHRFLNVSQFEKDDELVGGLRNLDIIGPAYDEPDGEWVLTIDPGEIISFSFYGKSFAWFEVVESGDTLELSPIEKPEGAL